MKAVDLIEFPTFYRFWLNDDTALDLTGDRYLHECGYKSAIYNPVTHIWEMSDEDYTMFLLRWSE